MRQYFLGLAHASATHAGTGTNINRYKATNTEHVQLDRTLFPNLHGLGRCNHCIARHKKGGEAEVQDGMCIDICRVYVHLLKDAHTDGLQLRACIQFVTHTLEVKHTKIVCKMCVYMFKDACMHRRPAAACMRSVRSAHTQNVTHTHIHTHTITQHADVL